jgi:hypothetical protein
VRVGAEILTATVEVPAEILNPGPRGYRVNVVDYDSSQGIFYELADVGEDETYPDRFAKAGSDELLGNPAFHAQNVYAIIMRTLARFELALGRRVSWSFFGHQLQVAPHAFADANAFYSERDQGLFFGYFPGGDGKIVFACLSHDVVAHETTHALLDGLRDRYTDPSLPDQAAFHEGFADVVALLSVFSVREVVEAILRSSLDTKNDKVRASRLTAEWLKHSVLLGLAEQMGAELSPSQARRDALRRSVTLRPDPDALGQAEFQEAHRRGEILVAAMMNAFASVWESRLGEFGEGMVPLRRVWEEGADAAGHLLTIAIRTLDYCPALDLEFGDYLSALLTADRELVPDDHRFHYRERLLKNFRAWGIHPASSEADRLETGVWGAPEESLSYDRIHLESLQRDRDEVFRFLWENRRQLKLYENAYTKVTSVRPCVRVGPDGFVLRETVAEYVQMIDLKARELGRFGLKAPKDMPESLSIRLHGGGTLIFDEFGQLKFHVRKRLDNAARQQAKIDYLWEQGLVDKHNRLGVSDGLPPGQRFARLHRLRTGYFNRV